MSEDEFQEKLVQDSENSKHESQDSDHSENESKNKDESLDKVFKDVIKGINTHAEEGTDEAELLKAYSK